MKLKDKALLVIEAIASDSIMEGLWLHPSKDKTVRQLVEKVTRVYECAHIARSPSCLSYHDNWVKYVNETYASLHKAGHF